MAQNTLETEIEDRKELYSYQKGDIETIFERLDNAPSNHQSRFIVVAVKDRINPVAFWFFINVFCYTHTKIRFQIAEFELHTSFYMKFTKAVLCTFNNKSLICVCALDLIKHTTAKTNVAGNASLNKYLFMHFFNKKELIVYCKLKVIILLYSYYFSLLIGSHFIVPFTLIFSEPPTTLLLL